MSLGAKIAKDEQMINGIVFLVAIAIGRVLKDYHPKYKWPNDILIKDKKVCGILIEREQDNLVL